ncbi:MAG: hypothetical protein AAGJ79_13030 [Verrucomicrobiota bacterium]
MAGFSQGASAQVHVIGWQTFDNAGANNNSGISDSTADSNSTFDSTPVGSNNGGLYLTGIIGPGASILGRQGYGQATNNSFLNGQFFGENSVPDGIDILSVTLADGSPGSRIGPQGGSGTSAWKFRGDGNQEFGDVSIKNESDYVFRLERIHFDARSLNSNANAAKALDLVYLSGGDSNLVRGDSGVEVSDLRELAAVTFPSGESNVSVHNVSASVAAALSPETAARLLPGDAASFRFRWSSFNTDFAEVQIDNVAFSGTFLDQNNGFAEIDPRAVVDPTIRITDTSLVGNVFSISFTSGGNVDVYRSTDLQDYGESPIAAGVAPGTSITIDTNATGSKAFYLLVPEGSTAPGGPPNL